MKNEANPPHRGSESPEKAETEYAELLDAVGQVVSKGRAVLFSAGEGVTYYSPDSEETILRSVTIRFPSEAQEFALKDGRKCLCSGDVHYHFAVKNQDTVMSIFSRLFPQKYAVAFVHEEGGRMS
jgi:hypothetical protein